MKFKYSLILLAAAALASCQDFLDRYPLEEPASSEFYSNEDELTLAVNGAYRSLYWLSNDDVPYQLFIDGTTDIVYIRGTYANMTDMRRGEGSAETATFKTIWDTFYGYIARCNNLLDNMHNAQGRVSETFYNRIEAQARFLRAYNYFYLVNLYGDVPFAEHVLDWQQPRLPKTPKEEIVARLYADLDFAKDHLPAKWTGNDEGRATRGTAFGLKARIALYNNDYETAAAAADSVIKSKAYEIYPSYEKLFLHNGSGSSEAMLYMPFLLGTQTNQIPKYVGTRLANCYSIIVPTQVLVDMYQCTDGQRIDQSPKYDPKKPYENRDPRLGYSILYPGQWHSGYKFEVHPDSTKTSAVINGETVRINNTEVTNAYGSFTGYIEKKYYDESDVPGKITQCELNFMLMRYAEVLLTYAEARIELNRIDQSVIDAINAVRQRKDVMMPAAALSMSRDKLRELVRYERTIELAMEGFRLLDIRRWKIVEHVLPGYLLGKRTKADWYTPVIPAFSDYGKPEYPDESIFQKLGFATFNREIQYSWPIPQTEIDRNPLLKD